MLSPIEQLRRRRDEYARRAGRELARNDTAHRKAMACFVEAAHAYEREGDASPAGARENTEGEAHSRLGSSAWNAYSALHHEARQIHKAMLRVAT